MNWTTINLALILLCSNVRPLKKIWKILCVRNGYNAINLDRGNVKSHLISCLFRYGKQNADFLVVMITYQEIANRKVYIIIYWNQDDEFDSEFVGAIFVFIIKKVFIACRTSMWDTERIEWQLFVNSRMPGIIKSCVRQSRRWTSWFFKTISMWHSSRWSTRKVQLSYFLNIST